MEINFSDIKNRNDNLERPELGKENYPKKGNKDNLNLHRLQSRDNLFFQSQLQVDCAVIP